MKITILDTIITELTPVIAKAIYDHLGRLSINNVFSDDFLAYTIREVLEMELLNGAESREIFMQKDVEQVGSEIVKEMVRLVNENLGV